MNALKLDDTQIYKLADGRFIYWSDVKQAWVVNDARPGQRANPWTGR